MLKLINKKTQNDVYQTLLTSFWGFFCKNLYIKNKQIVTKVTNVCRKCCHSLKTEKNMNNLL